MSTEITGIDPGLSADRLREFVTTVQQASVSAAARALGIPRSTLSRRLSSLESHLGVRLMHRKTRSLVLTPAGEKLYTHGRRVVSDTEAAWAAVRRLDDVPRGPLRVSTPDSTTAFADLFVTYAHDYPEVQLEISINPRHIDLIAEGIDVAIRFGEVHDPSLIVRRLWTIRSLAVASPGYLKTHGTPQTPADLAFHQCIVGFDGRDSPSRSWPLRAGGTVSVPPRLATTAMSLRVAAAVRGLGIAVIPEELIRNALDADQLRIVLEDDIGTDTPCNLVFADREFMPPQVRVFIDRAVEFLSRRAPDSH